jgi:hypothetical protein
VIDTRTMDLEDLLPAVAEIRNVRAIENLIEKGANTLALDEHSKGKGHRKTMAKQSIQAFQVEVPNVA